MGSKNCSERPEIDEKNQKDFKKDHTTETKKVVVSSKAKEAHSKDQEGENKLTLTNGKKHEKANAQPKANDQPIVSD